MYHQIVKRKILGAFDALSRGDRAALIRQMSPTVHHSFPGDHALGGQRSNRDDVGAWLDRLFRLFPGLDFTVHAIAVSVPPWNSVIGAEWTNSGTLLDGSNYSNSGAHILRLRWGKLTSFHAYLHDAEESRQALLRLAAHGLHEASTPPIVSSGPAPAEPARRAA
jgi:ketosteroid isomerase-like protein